MRVAVQHESRDGETRVALTPDAAKSLIGGGWSVAVAAGAGVAAHFPDGQYAAVGAEVVADATGDVILRVNAPTVSEAQRVPEGALHLSFLSPLQAPDVVRALVERKVTVVSFDLLPRITRAQYMDALSSQSTVSGYRAALAGARYLERFFPLLTTAAGTVRPARVLVMGVGVAGLQAIATAKRLGAKVRAYDVRAAAKEEAESAGATFVDLGVTAEGTGGYARELTAEELARQQAALADEVAAADVVITTAAVPGRKAPVLVTSAVVERMGEGSVIIDMAADQGGNCELTVAGQALRHGPALVVGLANPPAEMPTHASFLFANNVLKLLALFGGPDQLRLDPGDEIVAGVTVTSGGVVHHAPTAELLGVPSAPLAAVEAP